MDRFITASSSKDKRITVEVHNTEEEFEETWDNSSTSTEETNLLNPESSISLAFTPNPWLY